MFLKLNHILQIGNKEEAIVTEEVTINMLDIREYFQEDKFTTLIFKKDDLDYFVDAKIAKDTVKGDYRAYDVTETKTQIDFALGAKSPAEIAAQTTK